MLSNVVPALSSALERDMTRQCSYVSTLLLTFPSLAFPALSDWVERWERVLAVRLNKMADRMMVSTDYIEKRQGTKG